VCGAGQRRSSFRWVACELARLRNRLLRRLRAGLRELRRLGYRVPRLSAALVMEEDLQAAVARVLAAL
jgi:hypothetical protein